MNIATQIRLGLAKKGMSYDDLAEDLGVKSNMVEKWLQDEDVSKKYLRRIGEILNVPEFLKKPEMNIDKLCAMVMLFCRKGEVKTKLGKLLFYADFRHFKDYGEAISHFDYIHWEYGPTPDGYRNCLEHMLDNIMLRICQHRYDNGFAVNKMFSIRQELERFSDEEIKTMLLVRDHFKGYSAREITEFSKKEKGYSCTYNGMVIGYHYAEFLQI